MEDPAPVLPAARREKAASSINCRDFDSSTNDFDRWVKKFEKAVKLATNVRDDDVLYDLYKDWLPLKLDDSATSYLEQIDIDGEEWTDVKQQLSDLLVDPQQKLRWRARQLTITWDGKESLHTLASKVKRAVDKYDRHLPQDVRDMEYFVRFRMAFKKPLMRVIDMNCPEENQMIETAKDAVTRYLLASAEDDTSGSGDVYKSVAFAGAELHPDRATSLETSLASIATQMENVALSVRAIDDRNKSLDERVRHLEDRLDGGGRRYPSYDRSYRRDDYDSRGDRRPRDSWNNRSPRDRGFAPRRGYGDRQERRGDNRYRGDRRDSGSRGSASGASGRGRDDSRERYDSRGRSSQDTRDRNSDRRSGRDGGGYRRDDRSGDRGDRQGYAQRDRGYNEAYRAIDTGDEVSSEESDDDASARSSDTQSTAERDVDSCSARSARKGN